MRLLRDLADFGAGVIAGITVGFAAALILAPREGEETRTLIREGAEGAIQKPSEVVEDLQDRVSRAIEEGRQAAAEARAEMEQSAGLGRTRRSEDARASLATGEESAADEGGGAT